MEYFNTKTNSNSITCCPLHKSFLTGITNQRYADITALTATRENDGLQKALEKFASKK